jgi:hypothetical protein
MVDCEEFRQLQKKVGGETAAVVGMDACGNAKNREYTGEFQSTSARIEVAHGDR